MPRKIEGEDQTPKKTGELDFLDKEQSSIKSFFQKLPPKKRFLIKNFMPKDPLIVIAGPGGVGKGYLALQLAVSVATMKPMFGNAEFYVPKEGVVIFLSLEDDKAVFHERLLAVEELLTKGMEKKEKAEVRKKLISNLLIPPSASRYFPLYPDESKKNQTALIKFAKDCGEVRLIILDPANLLFADDLSKNDLVSKFAQGLREVGSATGASIIVLTHTNKASMTLKDGDSGGDSTSVLGAVSMVNAARLVFTLRNPGEKFLQNHGISGDAEDFVYFRNVKGNYVPRKMGNVLLKRVNGGVLEQVPLIPPDPMEHVNGMSEVIKENPDLGKMEIVKQYMEKAHVSRSVACKAITEGIAMEILAEVPLGKNNKSCYRIVKTAPKSKGSGAKKNIGDESDELPFD